MKKESSQPTELLLSVSKDATGDARIADRGPAPRHGFGTARSEREPPLPSTRDLARQLGISRRGVVDAYGQLTAEGYLTVRQGARPQVAEPAVGAAPAPATHPPRPAEVRFDFRPSMPDVPPSPAPPGPAACESRRRRSPTPTLAYGDPRGVEALRSLLADYLGRVRGGGCDDRERGRDTGYTQGLAIVCRALAESGATRIALESPADPEYAMIAHRGGLEPVPVPVDGQGIRVDLLERADVDAVAVTPAHQHPTGAVLSSER